MLHIFEANCEVKRMKNIDLSVIDEMKAKLSRFPGART